MTLQEAAGQTHLRRLSAALAELDLSLISSWGGRMAAIRDSGHRLLVAGNGGSAAQAQHLTAELVGRFEAERAPLSALALHAETSTVTAVGNDYGYDEVFARQVRAHGRPGDVLLTLSGSGRSANLLHAVAAAREADMTTWALTGPAPNPLAAIVDEAITVTSLSVATTQECHLVVIHLLCAAMDTVLSAAGPVVLPRPGERSDPRPTEPARVPRTVGVDLVIVGDAFLDRDHVGRVERVCSDDPALVVSGAVKVSRPGGAGLAAALGARDGHNVTLVTAIGRDDAGDELRSALVAAGVRVVDLGLEGPTAVKTRIRAAGRTLIMLDEQDHYPPIRGDQLGLVREVLAAADGVLVSDYGRGVTGRPDLRAVLTEAARGLPLVWDPHPRGSTPVRGTRLATPNRREAMHFAGLSPDGVPDQETKAARCLLTSWAPVQIAVTCGDRGAIMLTDLDSPPLVVQASGQVGPETDPCGAGDRFASAAAAALASGRLPTEAVTAAVSISSAYVAVGGPAAALRGQPLPPASPGRVTGPRDPMVVARSVRAAGGTVVATGGCFDLLHIGHIQMLEQARRLGDCLVVCLNNDDSITRLKGAGLPIVTVRQRAALLEALQTVDAVLVFEEDTPVSALRRLRPDIWVKGGDYSLPDLPEAELVTRLGGRTVLVPYMANRSTTSLINAASRAQR